VRRLYDCKVSPMPGNGASGSLASKRAPVPELGTLNSLALCQTLGWLNMS